MTRSNDGGRARSATTEGCAYTAESIVVLEGLEPVRRRPGMYVGDLKDGSGQHHVLWEVVSNAIDEHLAGHATRLSVTVAGQVVTVDDDGRGLHPDALEPLLTTLHATGTRDGHHPHVHAGRSLFGVGLGAVSALSRQLVVEVHHAGQRHRITCEKGKVVEPPTHLGGTRRRGTRLTFEPDPTLFELVPFDLPAIEERLWELSCLNPALDVELQGKRLEGRSGAAHLRRRGVAPRVTLLGVARDVLVEVILGWSTAGEPMDLRAFVSQHPTSRGSHVEGLWDAFCAQAPNLSRSVVRELHEPGLVAWIHVGLYDPRFGDPTRDRLDDPEVRLAVSDLLSPALARLPQI